MKHKVFKIIGIIVGAILLLALIGYGALWWYLSPKTPIPKSDVPIEYKIGWWAYQEALEVTNFESRLVYDSLNLLNSTAVIQYSISGTLEYESNWRPYVESAFLSERWEKSPENFEGNIANIEIVPVIAVKRDESYKGEKIDFKINIQDYLQAGGWGKNTYNISTEGKEASIEMLQRK